MIRLASWNVQGVGLVGKQKEVKRLIQKQGLSLVAVLETKLQPQKLKKACSNMLGSWNWVSNQGVCAINTRIIIGWDSNVLDVMVVNMTDQVMQCKLQSASLQGPIFLSCIYAHNEWGDRRVLWDELKRFSHMVNGGPWLLMGDFNIIRCSEESVGGGLPKTNAVNEFNDCIKEIGVDDLGFSGIYFSWKEKRRDNIGVQRKLDRILVNADFIGKYPCAHGHFLPGGRSDHACAVVKFDNIGKRKGPMFKFPNYVSTHPSFKDCVKAVWDTPVDGYAMFRVAKKLKILKPHMRRLMSSFQNMHERSEKKRAEVEDLQMKIDESPEDVSLFEQHRKVYDDWVYLASIEENFLKQRSKAHWLQEGDSNTRYFHEVVRERKSKHKIYSVCDMDGNYYEGEHVATQFVKHFEGILGKADASCCPEVDPHIFERKLSSEEAMDMVSPVTSEEIKKALMSIGDFKAPGPDGYSSKFFKVAWDVVGQEVNEAVKEFFASGKLLQELNHTLITLVPKIDGPSKVADYRPIACCNVVYKVISKIIANRIKGCLHNIVGLNQAAFIPGRKISENIMLVQDLLMGYHLDVSPARCALKIDIHKAYDSVSWVFLEKSLEGFGFHPRMIEWIMRCVKTVSYSIVLNGESHGYFHGEKGIRQGDPLSPYIFTLVMEVLGLVVADKVKGNAAFRYHKWCDKLKITHLCYADDLFMFCHGDVTSVTTLKDALMKFALISGLKASELKSNIICCGLADDDKKQVLEVLGFKEVKLPVKYLGIPLTSVCLKKKDCKPLIEKIKGRIGDWKARFLSYAGRVQLINSVLSAMFVYWGCSLCLPSNAVHDIEGLFRSFLWNQGGDCRGKCRVSWAEVCLPKENGGLGIRQISGWNSALMAGHAWDIISKKNTLWVKWIEEYRLKGKSFWVVDMPQKGSWIWKFILRQRDLLKSRVRVQIGDGSTTSAWFDPWLEQGSLIDKLTPRLIQSAGFSLGDSVADLWVDEEARWPLSWVGQYIPYSMKVPVAGMADKLCWRNNAGDYVEFTSKEAWKSICRAGDEVEWWRNIWHKYRIPKHAFILWMAMKNRLMTHDWLLKWSCVPPDIKCGLCNDCGESRDHLFFACQYSKQVWYSLVADLNYSNMGHSWDDVCRFFNTKKNTNSFRMLVFRIGLAAVVYHIWKERNRRVHDGVTRSYKDVYKDVFYDIRCKMLDPKFKEIPVPAAFAMKWKLSLEEIVLNQDGGKSYADNEE